MLTGKKSFTFDPLLKGPNMKLKDNNMTAVNSCHSEDFEGAYGNIEMGSDVHYFEIKINHIVDTNDVMVGLTPAEKVGKDTKGRCYDKIWGWHCTRGRKNRPNTSGRYENRGEYGPYCKIGDVVGCILEFKNGLGRIIFTLNGES